MTGARDDDWRSGDKTKHCVLVCGGRDYQDAHTVARVLDALDPQPTLVITGAAPGADDLATMWAADRGIETRCFFADWDTHGRAAGPIRNKQMLDVGKPHLVVAFPGGAGTANMVKQATGAGVRVITGGSLAGGEQGTAKP